MKVEADLFMMEATDGHIVNRDMPQNIVLAKFKINEEKNSPFTTVTYLFVFSD